MLENDHSNGSKISKLPVKPMDECLWVCGKKDKCKCTIVVFAVNPGNAAAKLKERCRIDDTIGLPVKTTEACFAVLAASVDSDKTVPLQGDGYADWDEEV